MEIVKVYKYDSTQEANGYRGEDYSKYVQIGNNNAEDITQELDTGEITLAGMPVRDAFTPETKLIIDTVERIGEIENIVETLHRMVQKDMVSQPILADNNYFDHHITLIEPSVTAQKRLVDNIAATYKLKSVTLDRQNAYPATIVPVQFTSAEFEPDHDFYGGPSDFQYGLDGAFIGKYFELEGQLGVLKADGTLIDNEYINIADITSETGEATVRFQIPRLAIYVGSTMIINGSARAFNKAGYASIDYVVEEFDLTEDYNPSRSWSGSFISNSQFGGNYDTTTPYIPPQGVGDVAEFTTTDQRQWLIEYADIRVRDISGTFYLKKYSDITASTPTYITQEIPITVNKRYRVRISLHEFADDMNKENSYGNNHIYYIKSTLSQPCYRYYNSVPATIFGQLINEHNEMTEANTTANGTFTFYEDGDKTAVYASAIPYSALALLQKAIINSSIYEKQSGTYIADINNENIPFYIDPNFIDELSSTLIIENFYNQKNLWEIMVEVGNYIHAIPELRFGNDDKFLITFNRLGRTDQQTKEATRISIYNSRGVEDYISATSSYVENMVQLGGYIEEWVAPKTTDETLLVSNDTAEIIVSKPIIELLSITVRSNISQTIGGLQLQAGQTADLTDYIFEENVYKTLGLDYTIIPNKGTAMYYSLGTNNITGGQFQLPQANTNIYTDYTIKKIIWGAFNGRIPVVSDPIPIDGYWTQLKVTDFSFLVRYRTKDSVRQNHTRPDLRKYLLNSKYDRYPEQNQFNNQTDVVVDSIKFGNNVYGKLIKTGNNEYTVTEWNDRYENLKHKGELYQLNGELYYVAKANHYNFSSYFLSEITYSKDYNQLSQIIGIPSEPRFYEISEQSLIWREFAINDLLLLTDNVDQLEYQSNYVFTFDHLADLVLSEGTDFARYALTVFKGDENSTNYSQTVGQRDLYIEVINPINAYSSENTLTYEYDMADNYSAGDKVVNVEDDTAKIDGTAYTSLSAVKYTDIYGKVALLDFYILGDIESADFPLTVDDIKAFPESPISTKQGEERPFVGDFNILATNVKTLDTNYNGRGIGLLKDCREALSINYNLQLITNSDTFVLSPYFFLPQKENVRIVLLADEVNKLSTGYINNSIIITPTDTNGQQMSTPYFDVPITKTTTTNTWDSTKTVVSQFSVDLSSIFANINDGHFTESSLPRVKAIAILCDVSLNPNPPDADEVAPTIPNKTQFVIARNIPEQWTRAEALKTWYFGSPKKSEIFKNTQ